MFSLVELRHYLPYPALLRVSMTGLRNTLDHVSPWLSLSFLHSREAPGTGVTPSGRRLRTTSFGSHLRLPLLTKSSELCRSPGYCINAMTVAKIKSQLAYYTNLWFSQPLKGEIMFGRRLRLARKKAGLSLRDLAKRLPSPVSAQAIGSYEAGRMMPRSAVLVELGRALDVSLDFLMGGQIEVLEGIEFRKHSRTSAKDRARVEAIVTAALEDYLAIEEVLEIAPVEDQFGNLRCEPVVSFDEVEQKAKDLRRHWSLGNDPINSMTGLLETQGIRVIAADLPDRFHGLACGAKRRGNGPAVDVVVVSCKTTVERKRLTLAHELAHRVVRDTGNPNIKLEKAMHRFAGAFLVPEEHLRAEVGLARRRLAEERTRTDR